MDAMLLTALQQVEKAYGDQVVLEQASLELRDAERVALIGRNGAGKTTVLRLLMGLETPDKGGVYRPAGVTAALLSQDLSFDGDATVAAVAEAAFSDLERMEAQLRAFEQAGLQDPERFARWEELHATFERRGGYARRSRRDAVLHALGFRGREQQSVRLLSGGERTRLGLARLLMAQPDLLLLDEPTNHLDIDMRTWLEGYLARYPGAAVIVSHDRAFLDAACGRTAEVAGGSLTVGDGAPSTFRAARAEERRIQEATYRNQERERERLAGAAARMKQWAGQNEKLHRRAKAMERRLERYADAMVAAPEREARTTRFRFDCDPSGEIVLTAQHLGKRVQERVLFEDVGLELRHGDRVALVGPNGAGKTTLLRMLIGETASDDPAADVRTGARVRLGYYDQDLRGVDPDATLMEEMIRLVGDVEAHDLLGRFLFPFDAQYKRIRDLSGGERARLALLKLTLGRYNLLVLDEPTNHLDVEMIEALEAALRAYRGTLLLVSHDRRFLASLVENVWEVREGHFEPFEGDWAFYQRKRRERLQAAQDARAAARAREEARSPADDAAGGDSGPSRWRLERMREELEGRVEALERELGSLAERLARPGAEDPAELATLGERHASVERELIDVMAEWENVTERLGAA